MDWKYQNQRKVAQTYYLWWSNSRFKKQKENAVNGVGGLANIIWDKKESISLPRDLKHHVEYI